MGLAIGMPELLSMLSAELDNLPDERKQSNNTRYTVEEAMKSAFSVFFMQSRSFLDHQRLMKSHKGRDNAASLFGIERIPCDNQIRALLDPVPASTVFGVFRSVYDGLSKTGNLKPYRCFQDEFLLTLDGTEYFSSQKIHCSHCCHRTHKNGSTTYFHAAVTPVLIAPGRPQVISLEPEFITPQDGHGQNYLAELLFCLNLLAYLFHTTLDLIHITYQQVRSMLVTRQTFFNDIRALTRYLWFESWQALFWNLDYLLNKQST